MLAPISTSTGPGSLTTEGRAFPDFLGSLLVLVSVSAHGFHLCASRLGFTIFCLKIMIAKMLISIIEAERK